MATRAQMKRTIKLKHADAQGREFIRVSPKNKTKWASCYRVSKPSYSSDLNVPTAQIAFALTNFETQLLFGIPAAFGLFASGMTVATVPVGAWLVNIKTGEIIFIQTIGAKLAETLLSYGISLGALSAIFLDKKTQTPQFASLNKPCDPGQGKF